MAGDVAVDLIGARSQLAERQFDDAADADVGAEDAELADADVVVHRAVVGDDQRDLTGGSDQVAADREFGQ